MIDFYYWPTPNGWKVSIMLEECGLDYRTHYVNIGRGDQFAPEFLAISPNNRMPAIVDDDPPAPYRHADANPARSIDSAGMLDPELVADTELPIGLDDTTADVAVFESGAILRYLGEKTGRFYPDDARGRKTVDEWLFWQVGNLGPAAGQLSHFVNYAEGDHPYAHRRFADEYHRCLGVLERRLTEQEYLAGDYSIADMISWPWVLIAKPLGQPLDEFPGVSRWRQAIKTRPAVQRAVDLGKDRRRKAAPDADEREQLFGQRAR